jgi:hypothetical protein
MSDIHNTGRLPWLGQLFEYGIGSLIGIALMVSL